MPKFDSTTISVGQKFHRLTVVTPLIPNRTRFWKCLCDCGKRTIVVAFKLLSGHTKSCGCFKDETTGNRSRTHGMSKTPVYRRWSDMITRATNPNSTSAHNYIERGITVCDGLRTFENFYALLGDPPPKLEVDRQDNNGNYSCGSCEECLSKNWPLNVRWAPRKVNARNRRVTRWITINGETKSMGEWVEISGVRQPTAWKRLNRGETPEEAFDFKERKRHN